MGDSQKVNSINYLKDNEKVSNVAENDDTLDDFDDSFESTRTTSGETLPLLDSQGTNNVPPEEVIKRPKGWGRRHTTALMASCGLMATYAMRFNMAIAITAMIKSDPMQGSSADGTRNDSASGVCVYPEDALGNKSESSALLEEYGEGEFEWNENQQAMVLSSFFWGYILTQIPGGWVVSKVGGKWPFGLGLALSGLMTLLTPIAARTNVGMLLYCRIIEGLGQGFIFPALLEILAAWSPPNERSFLSSMAYSGCEFGAALSMITSGYLIRWAGGWTSVFYFSGGVTMLWFILWIYLVYDTPEEHPRISWQEQKYIRQSIGTSTAERPDQMPFKAILTSGPVWAIAIIEFCHGWGLYTLLIELPTYFKTVLDFSMENNSWLSAAPSLAKWTFSNCITIIADICISKKLARKMVVRKTCHIIAEVGAALALVGASLVGCSRTSAVILLTTAVGVSGGVCASYIPNQVEIGPNYAGLVMGFTNTVGNLAGFLVSAVAGSLTRGHPTDQHRWRSVFFISAAIYLVSAFIFVAFATDKEQWWNRRKIVEPTDTPGQTAYENKEKGDASTVAKRQS